MVIKKLKEPGQELVDMVALKGQEILLLREQLSRQDQLLESQKSQWKLQLAVGLQYSEYFVELLEQLVSTQKVFVFMYMVYDQVKKAHHQMMRKNPADYEYDE